MEVEANVEESTRESKQNRLASGTRSNDNKRKIQDEIISEAIPFPTKAANLSDSTESNDVSIKQCTNNSPMSQDASGIGNSETFKKPTVLAILKRSQSRSVCETSKESLLTDTRSSENDDHCTDQRQPLKDPPFPYVEPSWGGKPAGNYKIEVLKSGVIIDTISLNEQSFYMVGRLPSCHLSLAHPTVSRYHAVLQYRSEQDPENPKGYYVYDLASTHGTFWNGNRIKPNIYVRLRGGHMLRFGCSQRKYILQAPLMDEEEESPYTLTELKEMRASELEIRQTKEEVVTSMEKKESEGIDWGMGEDADEETDLQENPYACITDEDLVLEDPKKTLRGWFEREGYDLRYQIEEKGLGQFLCWVDLPMEEVIGRSMRAEALVKGKKKEAVVQCALEACKILDKYGLLRRANHEARKRKARNWEAEDYYDSDEDNFLDRTGSIERKREHRMRLAGKLEEKVETYDSLLEKHKQVVKRISDLSSSIELWQGANNTKKEKTEEDTYDAFMSDSILFSLSKSDITKMKLELRNLRKEEASLIKLLNLTRPASLPAPSPHDDRKETVPKRSQVETLLPLDAQQALSEAKTTRASLLRGKKNAMQRKQTSQRAVTNSESFIPNVSANTTEETNFVEEVDSDDNDESTLNSSRASYSATEVTGNDEPFEGNGKQRKHRIQIAKTHKQEERKIHCDQDVYADNYSMWVPPKDQVGDGRTSLNEKYGY